MRFAIRRSSQTGRTMICSANEVATNSVHGIQEAEAQVLIPIARVVRIPVGGPHIRGVVDPTTTTHDTVRAFRSLSAQHCLIPPNSNQSDFRIWVLIHLPSTPTTGIRPYLR